METKCLEETVKDMKKSEKIKHKQYFVKENKKY